VAVDDGGGLRLVSLDEGMGDGADPGACVVEPSVANDIAECVECVRQVG
jgi:hypothetical protein